MFVKVGGSQESIKLTRTEKENINTHSIAQFKVEFYQDMDV